MLRSVSLFTGAGGLDYGLEAAGFNTSVAVDADGDACATVAASRNWPVIHSSTVELSGADLLSKARLSRGEVDLICAGPPCQPFSKSANWVAGQPAGLKDPRAKVLSDLARFIEDLRPRAILVENVPGFFGPEKGSGFLDAAIAKINKNQGTAYVPRYAVLNAADYGVPQIRRRLIMVAHVEGREFDFPKPTHGPLARTPWLTAWDAIADCSSDLGGEDLRPKGRWAGLLPSIPEGHNYLFHTERGGGLTLFGWRTRYWSFLLKLAKDQPAWTIPANPPQNAGPFHWDNRLLSTGELLRLQTFPLDVRVVGSRASKQRQLGNAVPSLLAEVLGRAIADQWFGRKPATSEPTLALKSRGAPPRKRRRLKVTAEYEALVGNHPPHPGKGLGPRAIAKSVSVPAS